MITFDMKDFQKEMKNAIDYSVGFVRGVESKKLSFNIELANVVKQALFKYVDSSARVDPDSLHHVYEWGQAGNPGARLFDIQSDVSNTVIRFSTSFLPSGSVSESGGAPFVNKASVMEAGTTITITPSANGVLAFENDGETVFTREQVTIESPGGNVAGNFERVVNEFFTNYLNYGIMKELMKDLDTPDEFVQGWGRQMSYSTGLRQGQRYLSVKGSVE